MAITPIRATVALVLSMLATNALSAPTPEQKCEGGKNKAAGGYAACLGKAESSYVQTGDATKYGDALLKCQAKYANSWTKLEGGMCVTSGDSSPIESFVEACSSAVATALGGGTLPLDVATCNGNLDACTDDLDACTDDLDACTDDLGACNTDLGTCDTDLGDCLQACSHSLKQTGQTLCYDPTDNTQNTIPCAGTGQDGDLRAGAVPSYTDNGDGTITDNRTGLMWEKLSDNGNIHDKDTQYTFEAGFGKIQSLNTAAFAGHTDWRMPNRRELESLADIGRINPAVDPVFHTGCVSGCNGVTCSCTKSDVHWSSSTYIWVADAAWKMNFSDGDIYAGYKDDTEIVRAVRDAF